MKMPSDDLIKNTTTQTSKEKKKQAARTIKWLEDNYCSCDDVCLPRGVVYEHYLDFCRKRNIAPACKATFGKLIRNKFPDVTSKRLGARGHSKYHYNGIGIKQSSEYYHMTHDSKGLTRFSGCSLKMEGGFTKQFSLFSKVGTLLPKFPEANELNIPQSIDKDKLQIFLTMYKIHCQCIVDTAISEHFEEIRAFLLHFWQGLPEHLLPLVYESVVINVIAVCDWILYKTLTDILIPSTMQELPENLLCGIRNLGKHWEGWLKSSLENLPKPLTETKLPIARMFGKSLKRQISFLHIAQVIRPVFFDYNAVKSMTEDVDQVDAKWLSAQALYLVDTPQLPEEKITVDWRFQLVKDFQDQLRKQPTVEGFVEWLDNIMEQKIMKEFEDIDVAFVPRAQDFLLKWTFLFNRLSFWLTLNSSCSFASFHLLSALLSEYLFLAVETRLEQEKEKESYTRLQEHLKNTASLVCEEYNAPTSCFLVTHEEEEHRHKQLSSSTEESKRNRKKPHISDGREFSFVRSPDCRKKCASGAKISKNVAIVPPMEHPANYSPQNVVAANQSFRSCCHGNLNKPHPNQRWLFATKDDFGLSAFQNSASSNTNFSEVTSLQGSASHYDIGVPSCSSPSQYPSQDSMFSCGFSYYSSLPPHNGYTNKPYPSAYHAPLYSPFCNYAKQQRESTSMMPYIQPVRTDYSHRYERQFHTTEENNFNPVAQTFINRENTVHTGLTASNSVFMQSASDIQNHIQNEDYCNIQGEDHYNSHPHNYSHSGINSATDFCVLGQSLVSLDNL